MFGYLFMSLITTGLCSRGSCPGVTLWMSLSKGGGGAVTTNSNIIISHHSSVFNVIDAFFSYLLLVEYT